MSLTKTYLFYLCNSGSFGNIYYIYKNSSLKTPNKIVVSENKSPEVSFDRTVCKIANFVEYDRGQQYLGISEFREAIILNSFIKDDSDGLIIPIVPTQMGSTYSLENSLSAYPKYPKAQKLELCRLIPPDSVSLSSYKYAHILPYYAQTLFKYITKTKLSEKITEKMAKHILARLCLGLSQLHHNGVVHGDLKTSNILVRQIGQNVMIDLCDFGGVTFEPSPLDGQTCTYCCRAPELWGTNKLISPKNDIWSLGITMIIVLTSKYPTPIYTKTTTGDSIENEEEYGKAILSLDLDKCLSDSGKNLSQEFKAMLKKMLSVSPDDRPTIDEIYKFCLDEELPNKQRKYDKIEMIPNPFIDSFTDSFFRGGFLSTGCPTGGARSDEGRTSGGDIETMKIKRIKELASSIYTRFTLSVKIKLDDEVIGGCCVYLASLILIRKNILSLEHISNSISGNGDKTILITDYCKLICETLKYDLYRPTLI